MEIIQSQNETQGEQMLRKKKKRTERHWVMDQF